MSDFPFYEVAAACERHVMEGDVIHQKFTCQGCGARQTMEEENRLFMTGTCEKCNYITDIVAQGCNYLLIKRLKK